MLWTVIAVWLVCCAASLSLPWPGTILVVLLCCVAFFELASPAAWMASARQHQNSMAGRGKNSGATPLDVTQRGPPPSSLSKALQSLTERLLGFGGRGMGEMRELAAGEGGTGPETMEKQALARFPAQPPATFLKGSVGSFSRGGLMVTHEGRVIYKINQDRGLISHPSLNKARHTIFGVFDGHGENGEHVAAYTMREVPRRMALHPDALDNPTRALQDVFQEINSSLPASGINAFFGGCTAVVALVRGQKVWVANAGDSRALVAGRGDDGKIAAHGLTRDQNPDSPGERERIESMGGFVSDPEEAGASARVWLDATRTMVGLAMARSIGDLAVERVGVIALPEITEYELTPRDEFLVLASDGVWEFIDNQEAAEVVQDLLEKGEDAAGACKGLMELANRRWSDMVGDYRDDITATVVKLPFLPPAAAAIAAAVNASTDHRRAASSETEAAAAAAAAARDGSSSSPSTAENVPIVDTTPAKTSAADDTALARVQPDGGGVAANGGSVPDDAPSGASGHDEDGAVGLDAEMLVCDTDAGVVDSADHLTPEVAAAPTGGARAGTEVAAEEAVGHDDEGLLSTPAVTPEDASEEDEEGGGVFGVGGEGQGEGGEETAETRRLLSAISQAIAGKEAHGHENLSAPSACEPTDSLTPALATAPFDDTKAVEIQGDAEDGREEEGCDENEEWEWDFGARENREPSREMREASREYPSGSLDALVTGIGSRET